MSRPAEPCYRQETAITTATETIRASSLEFALQAAALAADTRATNVVLLDLRGRSPVTEFFIIATGTSPRQMRTVIDELQELGQRLGFPAWQTAGYSDARWICCDFVNVVAHVFDIDSRAFYDLELLWGDAPKVDWRAALGLPPAAAGVDPDDVPASARFRAADRAIEEAQMEEARLEGDAQGEQDLDQDSDLEEEVSPPVVIEMPDESTGEDSVQMMEIDPPSEQAKPGRALYPTPLIEQEELPKNTRMLNANDTTDEDAREARAEDAADADEEAVSAEDLSTGRIETRPMGGVSASLSSTSFLSDDDDQQRDSVEMEEFGENRLDVPAPGAARRRGRPAAMRNPGKSLQRPAQVAKGGAAKKSPAKKSPAGRSTAARKTSSTKTSGRTPLKTVGKASAKAGTKAGAKSVVKPSAKAGAKAKSKVAAAKARPAKAGTKASAKTTVKPAVKKAAGRSTATKKSTASKSTATKAVAKKPVKKATAQTARPGAKASSTRAGAARNSVASTAARGKAKGASAAQSKPRATRKAR